MQTKEENVSGEIMVSPLILPTKSLQLMTEPSFAWIHHVHRLFAVHFFKITHWFLKVFLSLFLSNPALERDLTIFHGFFFAKMDHFQMHYKHLNGNELWILRSIDLGISFLFAMFDYSFKEFSLDSCLMDSLVSDVLDCWHVGINVVFR